MVLECDTVMPEIARLVDTIKRELKARGLTYRDVASALQLSEASIKRLFSSERFTVERLAQIAEVLEFTLAELLQKSAASVAQLHTLSHAQEAQLIADDKLLLVTVCALNDLSIEYIADTYHLARQEIIKRLRILDLMGVIELLPGDRIRRRVRRDFDWLPDGPIRRYFSQASLDDFLHVPFDGELQAQEFAHGVLTDAAQAKLKNELRRLRATLATLHEESIPAPISQKHGVGMLLALREWEPESFRRRRRDMRDKARAPRTR
jgi:transcriptional regulator with XRE-family HTH domain